MIDNSAALFTKTKTPSCMLWSPPKRFPLCTPCPCNLNTPSAYMCVHTCMIQYSPNFRHRTTAAPMTNRKAGNSEVVSRGFSLQCEVSWAEKDSLVRHYSLHSKYACQISKLPAMDYSYQLYTHALSLHLSSILLTTAFCHLLSF